MKGRMYMNMNDLDRSLVTRKVCEKKIKIANAAKKATF